MAADHAMFNDALVLLGGAVVAAPVFRKLGLGTVLGYLAAGIVIGPVLRRITEGEQILGVAELGIVFLLFVIGLELKPSRLWSLRGDIFGLGLVQVALSGLVLFGLARIFGLLDWKGALIAGFGLALSSTPFALQLLNAANDTNTVYGQRSFSILLFQDLAIVPLLALITILGGGTSGSSGTSAIANLALSVGAIIGMVLAGRYLLNPLFRIIARTGAREAMIAAALFVVMGSAAVMQFAGLSMAMGAFLAGVMLAESAYRHELEADIEPFRGILLAMFFMAVGLSLRLDVIVSQWLLIAIAVPTLLLVKALLLYGLCRVAGSPHNDAVRIAGLLPQGGEFGFVLFTGASAAGIFSADLASLLIAIVTLSMALTPVASAIATRLMRQLAPETMEETFEGAGSDVLMIGFSRFGQIASQILLASGRDVTILDTSADRVRQAERFGFKIYFGDGTRKDVLLAAGIERAKIVAICTHKQEVTNRIVELIQAEFPQARLFVRSYDRIHTIDLRAMGVEYELRETFESGLVFGKSALLALGVADEDAETVMEDIRTRDEERLALQSTEGMMAGADRLHTRPTPEPLVKPKREAPAAAAQ